MAIIQQILERKSAESQLYNLNLPTAATKENRRVCVVPMGVNRYGEHFVRRADPKGRHYFWATNDPPPEPTDHKTDLTELEKGNITLTALDYNMSKATELEQMVGWNIQSP